MDLFVKPDYLRKDELFYEITILKGTPASQMKFGELQKLLREVSNNEVDLQNFDISDPECELRTLQEQFCEIKEVTSDCQADNTITPSQYARVMTRLCHLTNRARDLSAREILVKKKSSCLDDLSTDISALMQSMGEFYAAILKGSEGSVSLPAPLLPGPSNSEGVAVNSFVQSGVRPLEAYLFQYAKLPPPIQRILSGQPTLSGDTFESV
jgi:hypothetical protein